MGNDNWTMFCVPATNVLIILSFGTLLDPKRILKTEIYIVLEDIYKMEVYFFIVSRPLRNVTEFIRVFRPQTWISPTAFFINKKDSTCQITLNLKNIYIFNVFYGSILLSGNLYSVQKFLIIIF